MSVSPLPTALQALRGRRFSFYPAVLNLEHNEWMYRRATWSEVVVVNTKSGEEAFIPRMFIGDASRFDSPIAVVSLKRELEWRDGAVCPHRRPVIELPVAVNGACPVRENPAAGSSAPHPERLAPVVNIRLEPRSELRTGKKIGVAIMLGAVGCFIAADIGRQLQTRQRAGAIRLSRSYLDINGGDDYYSVVHKLGPPSSERVLVAPGNRVFRELSYERRQFKIILMGPTQSEARYLGTLDTHGRMLDLRNPPDGANAGSLLRSVPLF